MNKNYQAFQGDVGIIEISKKELPENIHFKEAPSGFIVAYGEISGHHHKLVAEPGTLEIAKDERGYFLWIKKGEATLMHQSHAPQTIKQGIYFMPLQREFNEIQERRVLD